MALGLFAFGATLAVPTAERVAHADATPSAQSIFDKAVDSDPWGLGGVEQSSRAIVTDKDGKKRELQFEGKSRRYDPPRSKSFISFKAPADVAGMRFLQVQNKDSDDERSLYVPDLKRVRRVGAATRSEAFMGTDYSFADMDRRDLREGSPVYKGDETIGKHDCYKLLVTAKSGDSTIYSKFDMWVRKDNFIALKMVMYDKSGTAVKTLVTKEIQKHLEKWHVTRSIMTDHKKERTTEIIVEKLDPKDVPLSEFTAQKLEKG